MSAVALSRSRTDADRSRRPRWDTASIGRWTTVAMASAWVGLAVMSLTGWPHDHAAAGAAGGEHHHHGPDAAVATPSTPLVTAGWVAMWLTMVVAMMWPFMARGLEVALRGTYRRWRPGVAAVYLGTSTTLWLAAGVAALPIARAVTLRTPDRVWPTVWLLVALTSAWSTRRAARLWKCASRRVQATDGWPALRSASVASARQWRRCAFLCGPVMAAMVPMSRGTWAVMGLGAGAMWWEQRRPRAWRDPVPVALIGGAVAAMTIGVG